MQLNLYLFHIYTDQMVSKHLAYGALHVNETAPTDAQPLALACAGPHVGQKAGAGPHDRDPATATATATSAAQPLQVDSSRATGPSSGHHTPTARRVVTRE
jgi:hypothetical protein